MPFRPASAPTNHTGGLAQRRKDLARTGTRVQFKAALETFGPQREKQVPKDPLPDSDDDPDEPDCVVTLSPRTAQTAITQPANSEAKWWHVPDTQIEELVQHIEEGVSPVDTNRNLTLSSSFATVASGDSTRSPPPTAPSSTCRALAGSGRPKLRLMPNQTLFDAGHTDFSTAFCSLPTQYVNSERGRVEVSNPASSFASLQKPKFSHVSSAKNALLDSRPPLLSVGRKRPNTAPEPSTCQYENSACAAPTEQQRPSSSSSDVRSRSHGHATKNVGNSKTASSTLKATSVSEKELIQVELAFYNGTERIVVLIHPDAPMGASPNSKALFDKASLKGMVANFTGISTSDQKLLCRGFDVSHDGKSLRKLGISDGSLVTVYDKTRTMNERNRNQNDVVLACTAKLLQKQQSHQKLKAMRRTNLKDKFPSPKIRPKWGWGLPPTRGTAAKDWHATGQDMYLRFADHFSFRDVEETPSLSSIRASAVFTQPIEYMA